MKKCNGPEWSEMEDNIMRSLYPKHGLPGVRESLPGRSKGSIHARAKKLNLRVDSAPPPKGTRGWDLPTTNLLEQLECLRLRKWRGPVMAGPLVATIGGRYANC